jgi:hypothetical protein
MGISAQQHRVSIGLYNRRFLKCVRCRICPMFCLSDLCAPSGLFVSLLTLYFYILTYLMFMIVDSGKGPEPPNHPKTCTFESPTISSAMHLYVIFIVMFIFNDDGWGIKDLTGKLHSRISGCPTEIKIPLTLAPEQFLPLICMISIICSGKS